MKSISQLAQAVLPSVFISDTGSENKKNESNTTEGSWTEFGTSTVNQSNALLSPLESRTKLIAQVALNKLFTSNHFSICSLDAVMEAIGKGSRNHPSYKQLRALHCVDYAEMPKELRAQIPFLVNEVFTDSPIIKATENALNGVF